MLNVVLYCPEIPPNTGNIGRLYADFRASVPAGVSVYFLTTKTERVYWDATFENGDYLVFGCETRGLPESLLAENATNCLTIPQVTGRSLNLATSAGIVLYEGIRQLTKR